MPVLITGETGCGKEEVARAIHAVVERRQTPFRAINCSGLVATMARKPALRPDVAAEPAVATAADRPAPAMTAVLPDPMPDQERVPELPVCNLDVLRRLAVRQALATTDGHRGRAAALLGVSLNTMTRLVAEYCPESVAKVGRKRVTKPR